MNDNISLARYWKNGEIIDITIKDYKEMLELKNKNKAKSKISNMIYQRFYGRYIKSFEWKNARYYKEYKSGFAMMVSACLLIESLMSFKKGWLETKDFGNTVFDTFFDKSENLKEFKGLNFYGNIRCGILHQGETKCGWKITRKEKLPLLNEKSKTINATLFLRELDICLKNYEDKLVDSDWNSKIWNNCRRKMQYIIDNCKERQTQNQNYYTFDILSIIEYIANNTKWNRYVNEHYLHHYFTYLLREKLGEKEYSINLTRNRKDFRIHPEWPTYRIDDADENIHIPYRRYLNKEIPNDKNIGSCGHIDFVIGEYNRPDIGIEFKWVYGWDKDTIGFDFLKCLDNKLPFKTRISYNVITRKERLSSPGNKSKLEKAMKDALINAKDHLLKKNSLIDTEKKDLYLIITEIGKRDRRHWCYDKSQRGFIEKPHPLKLVEK